MNPGQNPFNNSEPESASANNTQSSPYNNGQLSAPSPQSTQPADTQQSLTAHRPTAIQPLSPQVESANAPSSQPAATETPAAQPQELTASPAVAAPIVPEQQPTAQTPPAIQAELTNATQQPVAPSPTQPIAGAVISSNLGTTTLPPVSGGKQPLNKKKLALIAAPVLAVILLAGGIFGLYLPNTPDAVWNTAMNRTGKALDGLVTSATEQEQLEAYKSSEITGKLQATINGNTYTGDLTTKFDEKHSDSGLNISLSDGSDTKKVNARLLSELPQDSLYPNLYFKISGLTELGLTSATNSIAEYDDKWISISANYLKSLGASYLTNTTDQKNSQISAADIAEVAKAASNVTREYVFTTNEDKALFVKESYVGKEKVGEITAYHYKVSINKQNAGTYCTALGNTVLSTNAYKKISGNNQEEIAKAKENAQKSCTDDVNKESKANGQFDLWIDDKYKLIHKIRQYDADNATAYTDIGQNYKGGDDISLFIERGDTKQKYTGRFVLDINTKTNITTGTFTYKSESDSNPYDITATITAKPLNGDVNITKPATSIPLEDILNKIGLSTDYSAALNSSQTSTNSNLYDSYSGVTNRAQDSVRKSGVAAIHKNLEVYYVEHDHYPTFANLNNASWRTANMRLLQTESLIDPNGSSAQLATTPTSGKYSYAPSGCNAQGCQSYTIAARLSDGTTYTKSNF